MVRSSSPVAHLLQGLMMCCALVDACLHTLVVRSGYFSYIYYILYILL